MKASINSITPVILTFSKSKYEIGFRKLYSVEEKEYTPNSKGHKCNGYFVDKP